MPQTIMKQTNIANLSNREIADMKFHQGYSYFTLQHLHRPNHLFNTIRQMKDDPNYIDANYYYGFLAFRDRNYNEALESFKIVENEKDYAQLFLIILHRYIIYREKRRSDRLCREKDKGRQCPIL